MSCQVNCKGQASCTESLQNCKNKCSCKETAQVFTVKWSHDRLDCLLSLFPGVHSLCCQGIFWVTLSDFYWTTFRFESTCMLILYILFWHPVLKTYYKRERHLYLCLLSAVEVWVCLPLPVCFVTMSELNSDFKSPCLAGVSPDMWICQRMWSISSHNSLLGYDI